jgi:hypothetical protein
MAIIIRMGAAHWDMTVPTDHGPVQYNFQKMTKDERRKFHSEFMSAYRSTTRKKRRKA